MKSLSAACVERPHPGQPKESKSLSFLDVEDTSRQLADSETLKAIDSWPIGMQATCCSAPRSLLMSLGRAESALQCALLDESVRNPEKCLTLDRQAVGAHLKHLIMVVSNKPAAIIINLWAP